MRVATRLRASLTAYKTEIDERLEAEPELVGQVMLFRAHEVARHWKAISKAPYEDGLESVWSQVVKGLHGLWRSVDILNAIPGPSPSGAGRAGGGGATPRTPAQPGRPAPGGGQPGGGRPAPTLPPPGGGVSPQRALAVYHASVISTVAADGTVTSFDLDRRAAYMQSYIDALPAGVKMRHLKGEWFGDPAYPRGGDGPESAWHPLCFSFHGIGVCYDNCRARLDHTARCHTVAEQERGRTFIGSRTPPAVPGN